MEPSSVGVDLYALKVVASLSYSLTLYVLPLGSYFRSMSNWCAKAHRLPWGCHPSLLKPYSRSPLRISGNLRLCHNLFQKKKKRKVFFRIQVTQLQIYWESTEYCKIQDVSRQQQKMSWTIQSVDESHRADLLPSFFLFLVRVTLRVWASGAAGNTILLLTTNWTAAPESRRTWTALA